MGFSMGIIFPCVNSYIGKWVSLTSNGNQTEWQTVFFLAAGIVFVGWLTFMVLVSTEEQPWAKEDIDLVQIKIPDEDCNMKPLAAIPDLKHEGCN